MNVGTLKRKIKSLFGDNYGIIIRDADIIDWINDGLLAVVRETDCLVETVTNTPSDYPLIIDDMLKIKRVTYNGVSIPFTTEKNLDNWGRDNSRQGYPVGYFIEGNTVNLFPPPIDTETSPVTVVYVRAPLEITSSIPDVQPFEIPIAYHEDLVRYVLALAHERDSNMELAKENMARFASNISQRAFEQTHGNPDEGSYIQQDPWDYYG